MKCSQGSPQTVSGAPIGFGADLHLFLGVDDDISALMQWQQVVQHYSGLGVSRIDEDRLVALSGLASEFAKAIPTPSRGSSTLDTTYEYAGGLWLDYFDALLWTQSSPGTRHRVRGIPTWSWASMATSITDPGEGKPRAGVGMRVVWEESSSSTTAFEVQEIIAVRVVGGEPQYGDQRFEPDLRYGDDHRFAILGILGCLVKADIHGLFDGTCETTLAARATGQRREEGRDMWRRVTCPSNRHVVRGWASLEHPEFQNGDEQSLFALVTGTTTGKGGLALGNWYFNSIPAYEVLFLRDVRLPYDKPAYEPAYERVGIGALFGYEFEGQYQQAEERKVWLV